MLAGAGVIGGGAVIAIGTRLEWATTSVRSTPVDAPGLPRVLLAGGRLSVDASGVGAGYLFGLGLLIALVPLGWLVTGPRVRTALALLAVGVAIGVFVGTLQTRADIPSRTLRVLDAEIRPVPGASGTVVRVVSGPGIIVTACGAVLAAIGALGGATVGGRAPRLGLPERPPGGPEGNGKL